MALSLSKVSGASFTVSNKKCRVYDVTFDSSYATGGEALVASDFGLKVLEQVIIHGAGAAAAGTTSVVAKYDYTNSKLQAFWIPAADGNAASAQALAQVTSTTDLSTYIVRITAIGF